MTELDRTPWLRARLQGALTGATAGLLLVLLEVPLRYLPALHGTDVPTQGDLPLGAALLALPIGATAGLFHPVLPALALAVAAALGSPTPLPAAGLAVSWEPWPGPCDAGPR